MSSSKARVSRSFEAFGKAIAEEEANAGAIASVPERGRALAGRIGRPLAALNPETSKVVSPGRTKPSKTTRTTFCAGARRVAETACWPPLGTKAARSAGARSLILLLKEKSTDL